ncbi:MAG: hypothetical protein CME06_12370 [Gemmatimonadetes bacterium]|nr:hypothetical protein [Gemmatimonadota bacterium]
MDRYVISTALRKANGNQRAVARAISMRESTLRHKRGKAEDGG